MLLLKYIVLITWDYQAPMNKEENAYKHEEHLWTDYDARICMHACLQPITRCHSDVKMDFKSKAIPLEAIC